MVRSGCALVVVVIVAGGALSCRAELRPAIGRQRTALDEAAGLAKQVEQLREDGKFEAAIPIAERVVALREHVRGPAHPEVAQALEDLAALYREQGVHDKAEAAALRSLGIREKAHGPGHIETARSLDELGEVYRARGKYAQAAPVTLRALEIREKELGPGHADVAHTLDDLGMLYYLQGAYDKAEPVYVRALAIREKVLGAVHVGVAETLNNLAALHDNQGNYKHADSLYRRALDIREKRLGPMHPAVATSLNGLAMLRHNQGEYNDAEPLFLRALAIREKVLGPMHPAVAKSLNDLALLYSTQGALEQAEPLYLRALAIREKVFSPNHPDLAEVVSNLALLYSQMAAYDKAEPLAVRALEIDEKVFGPMHYNVALSLNNLARLYHQLGAYGKAEPLLVRALGIFEEALGPAHTDVALGLNNLAGLYADQGAYRKAEPLLVRALAIREKTLGATHPDVALSLHNLADIQRLQGGYDQATPLLVRALAIREQTLGPAHPYVADSLTLLAAIHAARTDHAAAKPLYVRALAIREKALGPMHPRVASSLRNLGLLHQAQRSYGEAEPLLVRALDIDEKALGPVHPKVATSLNNLAGLYRAQGAYDKAEPLFARAAELREAELHVELARLSEPRKRALMLLLQGETESLISLYADAAPRSQRALDLALTTTLRRKGRVLDSLVDNETTLRAHLTPQLGAQLDELTRARGELTSRLYAPLGSPRAGRAAIDPIRARIEELESALSAASAEFRTRSEPVTIAKIQVRLPRDAVLVELVRYHRFDPRQVRPWQEERYGAFILGSSGPPRWIALGPAAPIDAAIDAMLAALDSKAAIGTAKAALRRVDGLAFAPIRASLQGARHLILAPDGKLNLVPFEALLDGSGRHVLESHLISHVTSGRDLLSPGAPRPSRATSVIVAGPDYGPAPPQGRPGNAFPPLAGALGEAADLERYFPTALTGGDATRTALTALTAPAMLHIATHTFYARNRPRAAPTTTSLPRNMVADGGPPLLPPPRADDPADGLDRAGLALAGANQDASGIVTAREIAGLDWRGTQLVVLSGCESGVGATPSGEGVYGMRRALVLAGTASQVVSLWNVDDESTRALMRHYYAELARGTGRAEALRRAKLRLMRQARYAHPYDWAAFIAAGDWTPLDKGLFP
jgi:CHAT domain-containing protein/tetratricopeptide (TPR) repeat protein